MLIQYRKEKILTEDQIRRRFGDAAGVLWTERFAGAVYMATVVAAVSVWFAWNHGMPEKYAKIGWFSAAGFFVLFLGGCHFQAKRLDAVEFHVLASLNSWLAQFRVEEIHADGIADWLAHRFQKKYTIDLRRDPAAWKSVFTAAQDAALELQAKDKVLISLPALATSRNGNPLGLRVVLDRRTAVKFSRQKEEFRER